MDCYNRIFISVLLWVGLYCGQAEADIYRYQNADGNTVFSDTAVPNADVVVEPAKPYRYRYRLDHVYDGDTLVLKSGDHIRLIGINTPEISSHFRQGEPGGQQAKTFLVQQLKNDQLLLEYDVEKHDRYQRQLAYCFLPNGVSLNQLLLKKGLAVLSLQPPNLRYAKQMIAAQQQAIDNKLGIWAMAAYQPIDADTLAEQAQLSGWQRIDGRITAVKTSRKYIRLIFNQHFEARIAKSEQVGFEPSTLTGRQVEVRGWLSHSKQHFSMRLRHPSALILR